MSILNPRKTPRVNLPISLPRVLAVVLGVAGWYVLASVFPEELMPYPVETIEITVRLLTQGSAFTHLYDTIVRTVFGFLIALIFGTILGVLMGVNEFNKAFLTPYIVVGLAIPAIAWAIITVLVFGLGLVSPVAATALITFPYIAINVWEGVEDIDTDLVNMSRAFEISNVRLLSRMILPNVAPALFSAFRFGLAISWRIVTIAEMVGASSGIGYKIIQTYRAFRFEEAWGWAVIFIVVILLVEYGIFQPLERSMFEYRQDVDF